MPRRLHLPPKPALAPSQEQLAESPAPHDGAGHSVSARAAVSNGSLLRKIIAQLPPAGALYDRATLPRSREDELRAAALAGSAGSEAVTAVYAEREEREAWRGGRSGPLSRPGGQGFMQRTVPAPLQPCMPHNVPGPAPIECAY